MRVHAYMFKQSQDIDPMDCGQYRKYKLDLLKNDPVSLEPLQNPELLTHQDGTQTVSVAVLKGGCMYEYKAKDEVVVVLTDFQARMVIYGALTAVYRETCPVSDIFVARVERCTQYKFIGRTYLGIDRAIESEDKEKG